MHVCYVLAEFPNLTQTFVRDELRELSSKGHEVEIFAFSMQQDLSIELLKNWVDVPVVYYSQYIPKLDLLSSFMKCLLISPVQLFKGYLFHKHFDSPRKKSLSFKRILYLSGLLHEKHVSHIHSHFGGGSTEMAMYLSKVTRIPFSFTTHAKKFISFTVALIQKHWIDSILT